MAHEWASARQANFTESKPQQTGTGLLIRHGEVATTSGSTILRSELALAGSERRRTSFIRAQSCGWQANSLPGRLIVGQRPLKARMLVQFQPRQPDLASRASTRPMVKQDHVSPTKRC